MAPANIGIGWRLSSVSGWGVYGLNLTLQLLNKGRTPVLDPDALDRAACYDLIVTGSSWNQEILAARGVDNVTTVFQGIDPALFRPRSRNPLYPTASSFFRAENSNTARRRTSSSRHFGNFTPGMRRRCCCLPGTINGPK